MGDQHAPKTTAFVRRRLDWLLVPIDDVRVRRPSDIALVVLGLVLVLMAAAGSAQLRWLEGAIDLLVGSFPSWLTTLFQVMYGVGFVYAALVVVAAIVAGKDGRPLLRDLLVASAVAIVLIILLARWVGGDWPSVFPELASEPRPAFPVVRVASVTAILLVAGPSVVAPFRKLGWFIVGALLLLAVALGYGLPADGLGGLGVGLIAAGTVMAVFGSPRGFPGENEVREDLAALGVSVDDLQPSAHQTWGARQLVGTRNGDAIAIRVYGRDARDTQMLTKWWRSVWYRDPGPALTKSSLHQVEHEALLTILAADADLPALRVLAVGMPTKRAAYLVTDLRGDGVASGSPDAIDHAFMVETWRTVAAMHDAYIAHGRLNLHSLRVDGTTPVLQNFHAASLTREDGRIQEDVAELLAGFASVAGVDAAVTAALEGLGEDRLGAALPYLQRSAVSTEGRSDLPSGRKFFTELRTEAARRVGVEPPKVAQVRRLSLRSLLMFALTLLAAYALIGMLADIDWPSVWQELQNADWAWIVVALIVSQMTLVTYAFSMMAAVSRPIPLFATMQLESAIKMIQLAIGGAAGRMATNIAYLRKFGVSATDSVTQGGVDSFAGFVVQIVILVVAIVFGNADLVPDDVTLDVDWVLILALIAFAVVVSALMLRFVPAIRERVIPAVKQMWDGLKEIGTDPSRLLKLFGANLASNLLYALSLWLTAVAFGWELPFMTALVIYIAMALLSGLLPIPGGVGVSEAVLTAGLTAVGVDQNAAFAIAVVFRVASAYLPPVWGWFSLQWLQKNDYL